MVTNDDGIDSEGLIVLARTLKVCGHEVVIAAPREDYSGFGSAIGPLHVKGHVEFEARDIEALTGVEAYAVDGPPGLCAFTGANGGFGDPPDLVVSGINAGVNIGRAVLFSGTVGAALASIQFGVPAMAISLQTGEPYLWETAAACAASLVDAAYDLGAKAVLNVNVPNRRAYAIKGMRAASLALEGGSITAVTDELGPGKVALNWTRNSPPPADSDIALLLQGWVTLSVVTGPRDASPDLLDSLVAQLANEELAG
jgi:5'-nucleotidase